MDQLHPGCPGGVLDRRALEAARQEAVVGRLGQVGADGVAREVSDAWAHVHTLPIEMASHA